jgi:hypothetical protein
MKFVSKAVAFGAAAALSATGLVTATGVSANAETVTKSVTYTCHLGALGGDQPVAASYTVPVLPATVPGGTAIPAQAITATFTVPSSVSAVVVGGFGGHINGTISGNGAFGSQSVAAALTIPDQTITDASAPATLQASGTWASVTPSTAGANAVSLPSAVTATFQNGAVSVPCESVAGSDLSLGTVTVANSLAVKAPKSVKAGHVVKVKVTTSATGKAVAKIKGKKVAKAAVKNGKATLKVKKGLKKGVNKIVVSVGSLKQTVKVKVK